VTVNLRNQITSTETGQESGGLGASVAPASDSSSVLHPAWVVELIMAHSAETWERAALEEQTPPEFHTASS